MPIRLLHHQWLCGGKEPNPCSDYLTLTKELEKWPPRSAKALQKQRFMENTDFVDINFLDHIRNFLNKLNFVIVTHPDLHLPSTNGIRTILFRSLEILGAVSRISRPTKIKKLLGMFDTGDGTCMWLPAIFATTSISHFSDLIKWGSTFQTCCYEINNTKMKKKSE